jgi:Icc-related predicted phosphoesterase
MKILAVSDQRLPQLNNAEFLRTHHHDVELLISCGDMDPEYLDFIASVLSVPLYYVRGNHDQRYTEDTPGGINVHRRILSYDKITIAGLEGSIRYNKGSIQYTEAEMTSHVLGLMPRFLMRRLFKGYGVDLLATHSPPRSINDLTDWAHRGFRSFRWLIRWGRPRYLIHGHIDLIDQRTPRETIYLRTRVININPSQVLTL